MYFVLQSTNKPTRSWARKTPEYLKSHFEKAFNDIEFIDRDYLDEEIDTLHFIPKDYKDVSNNYRDLISEVSKAFETVCIWEKVIQYGVADPIISFSINGYHGDILMTHRVLSYIINSYNNLRTDLTEEYRRTKINRRRRSQYSGEKTVKYADARVKTRQLWENYLSLTHQALQKVEFKYSVMHSHKIENIENFILGYKKLDFKNYHIKRQPILKDASCKKSVIILNRVI